MPKKFSGIKDNSEYLQWVKSNPNGFVVNSYLIPKPSYLKLHRATCRTITGKPANGKWWTKDYSKTCSHELNELETWALKDVGGSLKPCKLCKPNY